MIISPTFSNKPFGLTAWKHAKSQSACGKEGDDRPVRRGNRPTHMDVKWVSCASCPGRPFLWGEKSV